MPDRRADPNRVNEARRITLRNTLISSGMDIQRAESWIVAWEAEAERRGMHPSPEYWQEGGRWIGSNRPRLE